METVHDIKLCSKCTKTCVGPRSLTCFHSFCLQCLLQSIKEQDIKPDEGLTCPAATACDTMYAVPKEGLRRNDFIIRQIKAAKESSASSKDRRTLGLMCPNEKEHPEGKRPLATSYCIECKKEMCDRCTEEHSKQKSSNTHMVFGLGSQDNDDEEPGKQEGTYCQQHPKKQVELYCKRCTAVICMTCFAETHKSHDCIDLDKYNDQLLDQIKKNSEKATVCLEKCNTMNAHAEAVEREFLKSADEAKASIDKRRDDLKEMIDKHAKKLNNELERKKKIQLKQISEHKKMIDKLTSGLKTFKTYCCSLASMGSPVEISRDVAGINDRQTELHRLQEEQAGRELSSVSIVFKPQELENYERDVANSIGIVEGKII